MVGIKITRIMACQEYGLDFSKGSATVVFVFSLPCRAFRICLEKALSFVCPIRGVMTDKDTL